MKYSRFEELPVWNAAIELAKRTYGLTSRANFAGKRSLADQLERAAVSGSNNIAEGFERGTNQELVTFLYIARGSAGEVRSMLCLLERMPDFESLKDEIIKLESDVEAISRQLGGSRRSGIRPSRASDTRLMMSSSEKKGPATKKTSSRNCVA